MKAPLTAGFTEGACKYVSAHLCVAMLCFCTFGANLMWLSSCELMFGADNVRCIMGIC